MNKSAALLPLALVLCAASALHAATTGMQTSNVGDAVWDTWTTSPNIPSYSGSPVFSATFTPSAASTSGGGERTYDFNSTFTFTIDATANYAISSLTVQIRSTVGNDDIGGAGGAAYLASSNILLNGSTAATSFTSIAAGDSLVGGPTPSPYYIYTWTWSSLSILDGEAFSLSFAPTGSYHTSYDAVGFSAVPEPATTGLLIVGAGLALLAKRCRRA